jgi:hypothetical protein
MVHDFTCVESFEEIIGCALEQSKRDNLDYRLNFSLKVSFDISLASGPQLRDADDLASQWQAIDKPDNLYINHGQFIRVDGIPHVIEELRKHSSNRALFSLISQDNIVGSGDNPIPSFLILQSAIESDHLYVTTYFRALEVTQFLRINLEEIRQIVWKIWDEFRSLKRVNLHIFAFRAYANPEINTLQIAQIDSLDQATLLKLLEKNPVHVVELFQSKRLDSTVIDLRGLQNFHDILKDSLKSADLPQGLKKARIVILVERCLQAGGLLADSRKKASHDTNVAEQRSRYICLWKDLISELQTCL